MAELADAHGSGPCDRKVMEVQVLLSAPRRNHHKGHSFIMMVHFLRRSDCKAVLFIQSGLFCVAEILGIIFPDLLSHSDSANQSFYG